MLRVGVARVGRLVAPSYSRRLHTAPVLSAIQLNMPSLSPTMEEGTIVKWHKVRLVAMLVMIISRRLVTPCLRGTWCATYRQIRQ